MSDADNGVGYVFEIRMGAGSHQSEKELRDIVSGMHEVVYGKDEPLGFVS
jgi:hypothetical protein